MIAGLHCSLFYYTLFCDCVKSQPKKTRGREAQRQGSRLKGKGGRQRRRGTEPSPCNRGLPGISAAVSSYHEAVKPSAYACTSPHYVCSSPCGGGGPAGRGAVRQGKGTRVKGRGGRQRRRATEDPPYNRGKERGSSRKAKAAGARVTGYNEGKEVRREDQGRRQRQRQTPAIRRRSTLKEDNNA